MPSRRSILIVDDFAAVRRLLAMTLTDSGFHTVEAENGFDALERLGREPFDLVLTDICMPGLDGLELVRAVHRLAPAAPVVVMTGAAKIAGLDQASATQSPDLYVDAVCLKPFRTEDVVETIRGLLAA
jgi:CheY-like chemotaxis protein